jgi:phosphopantothenoylcysteine decarboxylase/phosphopantothenate--cysteine ligase
LITNKRILISAGPTWVAIDKVRVISNIASSETGFILAEKFKKLGAKVTLLLGPGNFYLNKNKIKVIHFKYFAELKKLLRDELKKARYNAVIHAAAVSDYQPEKVSKNKISSHHKSLKINLVPTKKLINDFKKYKESLITVGFKFEPDATQVALLKKGLALLKTANLNLVVANSNKFNKYCAHILDGINQYGPFLSKEKMAQQLSKLVIKKIL